ncbi:hypothetical protein CKO45_21315, partial [Paracraurococcus ruber]|nr:hypothetical protein [Paracraurococcus ruber]
MSGLAVAGAGLLGLALLVVAGLGALARQEKRRARVLAVAAPLWPAVAGGAAGGGLLADWAGGAVVARLARLFGIDRDRLADYPVRWWLVPVVTLPLARALAGIAAALLGDPLVFATPVAWVLLSRASFGWMEQRRIDTLFRQFPDALGLVTRAVRVGIPVTEAVRA